MILNSKSVFIAIFLWSLSSYAQPLILEGFTASELKSIKKEYPSIINSPTASETDELIRTLYQTEKYERLEIFERNGRLVLKASPVKKIEDIEATGNDSFSLSTILENLEVSEGQNFNRSNISVFRQGITEFYHKNGYFNAKVNVLAKEYKDNSIAINIVIEEGEPCRIEDIAFDTSNEDLKNQLSNKLKYYMNSIFDSTTADNVYQIITDYFIQERYLNAQSSQPSIQFNENKTKVKLSFTIDNPYKFIIFFFGNKFYDNGQLVRELKLQSSERFGLNPSAEIADRVRQAYLKQGFNQVKVSFKEVFLNKNFIRKAIFDINEGIRARIDDVEVSGRISRSPSYYRKLLNEYGTSLYRLGYFNSEDIELGTKNLITHLQNEGFLQARIQSTRVDFSKTGEFVDIRVLIDEGIQTKIRDIKFEGLKAFSENDLLKVIGFKPGDPLNLPLLEESFSKIQEHYLRSGYLDIKLIDQEQAVKYSENNTEASITYLIHEGPMVKVQSILVQGNEKTKEYVILKELEFTPGDTLTSESIRDSEYRLQRLGLFNNINIKTLEANSSIENRTVIVDIAERNPGLFNFGISFNNEVGDQLGLSVLTYSGIAYRNLAGTARAISLRGELNINLLSYFPEYDITAGYLEPFIFGTRTRGRANLNRSARIFKSEIDRLIALETNQISFLLERDLSRFTKVTWNLWSLAATKKFAFKGSFEEERLTIATIGPTFEWDTRDNPFLPSKGLFYRVNSEYANPEIGSTDTVNYYKVTSNFNTYYRLGSPRLIWANSVRGGYLQNLSTLSDGRVPEEVMFTLGGRTSIRGFDPASIPSRYEFSDKYGTSPDAPMFVKTDSHFYLVKTELRFPIKGDFGGVIFYDGGTVKITGLTLDDEYRDAFGFGFRLNTPVGPASAEIAWKLDRKRINANTEEAPYRFHLSIGAF